MATLISGGGDGNFTATGTWKNVCTGTGAVNTTLTAAQSITSTTYQASAAFTVTNTEVIEGFALHLQRSGTTGTLTVGLSDDNGSTYTKEVTVNLSDLPTAYSWVFFKFGSTLTADGGSDYKVAIKLSTGSSGVSIYRGSATSNDWSHILREDSAPGSLAAGDVFYIMDALTGAGAKTTNTVTMNNTDTTNWGAITVGFGSFNYGTSGSTNYYLKTSGNLTVWGDGTFTIGTVGSAMPSTSTAVLEFDPTSDGEFGLLANAGSTVTMQGASMTKVWTYLNSDAVANATSLTTADSTGWADNDQIVIASTSRTYTECEIGAMNGAASGTTITVDGFGGTGGGLAYAHSGSNGGPAGESTKAEIINLTRNVKVRSATSTLMTYFYTATTSTVDIDYVEFYYLGENKTGKRGIEVATTTGAFSMQYCSMHDFEDGGYILSSTSGNNHTWSYNVCYKLNTARAVWGSVVIAINAGTGTSAVPVVTGNVLIYCSCTAYYGVINSQDVGMTLTNNIVAGAESSSANAMSFKFQDDSGSTIGTMYGNIAHSGRGNGIKIGETNSHLGYFGAFNGFTAWRNAGYGLEVNITGTGIVRHFVNVSSLTAFGNTVANVACVNAYLKLTSPVLNGDASYATTYGIQNQSGLYCDVYNGTLGSGEAHTTSDIYNYNYHATRTRLYNTTLASSTETSGVTGFSSVLSHKHDANSSTFKAVFGYGTIASDTSTRHTASGYSWKLTPSSATYKLILLGPSTCDTFKAAVNASAEVTVTAYVYKDSSYNGNAPRLVLVGGYIGGIANDVTDSLTVAHSNWEQLSVSGTPNEAGVIEFYIDCDGTAGNVYVDDVAITQA